MSTNRTSYDWARHWDTLCLGTVTIATAALGAVIVVAGFSDGSNTGGNDLTSPPRALATIIASGAFVAYIVLATIAGLAIFFVRTDNIARIGLKRVLVSSVYLLFVLQAFALGIVLLTNVAGNETASEKGAATNGLVEPTTERLTEKVGPEFTGCDPDDASDGASPWQRVEAEEAANLQHISIRAQAESGDLLCLKVDIYHSQGEIE